MKPIKAIRVMVTDDNAVVRQSLCKLLKEDDGFIVVGEAQNGREAVAMARTLLPDVILMDVSMPVMNGLDATRQILAANPYIKVIILSAYDDKEYVARAKAEGAAGYLGKLTFAETLTKAVRDVVKGCPFFGPSTGKKRSVAPSKSRGSHETPEIKGANLTSVESDVLQLLAGGAANTQVAAKLSISIEAVEKHLLNLMGKLKIDKAVDLARFAIPAYLVAGNVRLMLT